MFQHDVVTDWCNVCCGVGMRRSVTHDQRLVESAVELAVVIAPRFPVIPACSWHED